MKGSRSSMNAQKYWKHHHCTGDVMNNLMKHVSMLLKLTLRDIFPKVPEQPTPAPPNSPWYFVNTCHKSYTEMTERGFWHEMMMMTLFHRGVRIYHKEHDIEKISNRKRDSSQSCSRSDQIFRTHRNHTSSPTISLIPPPLRLLRYSLAGEVLIRLYEDLILHFIKMNEVEWSSIT